MQLSERTSEAQASEKGQEPAQTSKDALKQSMQKAQGLGEGLMLVWAWCQSWRAMVTKGLLVHDQWPDPDVTYLAPLVVMMVGLFTTNVLGVLHFWRAGFYREAGLAAVDLDSPYLGFEQVINAVRGEINPEFQKVRLRNSIWRSLPLAMLTCALTSRVLVEVPFCQAVASGSSVVVGIWPEKKNRSLWVSKLGNLQPSEAEWADYYRKFREGVVGEKERKSNDTLKLVEGMLNMEKKLWNAAHCNESTWTLTKLPLKLERVEDQVGAAGDETDEPLAHSGLSNLIPFNVVIFQQARREALAREDTLKDAVIVLINNVAKSFDHEGVGFFGGMALRGASWEYVLDQAIDWLRHILRSDPVGTMQSSRPWKYTLPRVGEVNLGEWKVPLAQASALLLSSVLPIRKQILSSFGEAPARCKLLVTLYVFLDMALLLTAWLLCAVAPLAIHFGNMIENYIKSVWPMIEKLLQEKAADDAANKIFALLMQTVGDLLIAFKDLAPAMAWDTKFFLYLSFGSLGFLAASAAVAYAVSPDLPLPTCFTTGVCGPLWVFTEEASDSTKACKLVVFRSVLLSALVAWSWAPVTQLGLELFSSLTIKRHVGTEMFWCFWLSFSIVTCFLGGAVALSLPSDESDSSSSDEESNPKDNAKSSASSNYGTFSESSESIP
eukprot:Skav210069  [mRNA]  locus=scaffold485:186291:188285:+ [translate_table: standard]